MEKTILKRQRLANQGTAVEVQEPKFESPPTELRDLERPHIKCPQDRRNFSAGRRP